MEKIIIEINGNQRDKRKNFNYTSKIDLIFKI